MFVEFGDDDPVAVVPGDLVGRVDPDLVLPEALLERVVGEQAADERVAEVEDQLDRLDRLDRTDDAGEHAQHAGFGAAGSELGGRGLGHHVAVRRSDAGIEDGDHPFEPEDRAVDDRDAELHGGVVDEVAGREVVGPVDDYVPPLTQYLKHVVGAEADVVGDDVHVGVDGREGLLGGVDLALADALEVVENLALEVGRIDDVHVDDADRPDAGGGEVQGGGGAEAAGAEQQHLGVEQLQLTFDVDLGQEEVALVPVPLVGGEVARCRPVAALVLPLVEPAGDGDDVGVAELGEGLGGEGGAGAAGAVHHERGRLVGDPALDARLERAAGDVDGAGDGALLVLVGLADVEDDRPRSAAQLVGGGSVDLADLGLRGGEQLSKARHRTKSLPTESGFEQIRRGGPRRPGLPYFARAVARLVSSPVQAPAGASDPVRSPEGRRCGRRRH